MPASTSLRQIARTGRPRQICELVDTEPTLVLNPPVLVRPFEVKQSLLYHVPESSRGLRVLCQRRDESWDEEGEVIGQSLEDAAERRNGACVRLVWLR